MTDQQISAYLTNQPIRVKEILASVESELCGAVVSFSGNVRSQDQGKNILSLEYEIHPSSEEVLIRVVKEVCAKFEILYCTAVHRFGEIPIGESALLIAVSAAHRQPALQACAQLVDEIKSQIPIWKHQVFSDGTSEWVNSA